MSSNTYPIIAREGWPLIALLVLMQVVAYYFLGTVITVLVAVILFIFLFLLRDPARTIPSSPLAIVSPVSGRVLAVEEVDDPWIDRRAISIRIKTSLLDVYSIRSPSEGKIVNQWTRRQENNDGKRRFAYRLRTDENDEIVVVFNLNFLNAFFLRFYVHSGERIGHGQRCGYLFFGGLVDVLIPPNSKVTVKVSEETCSGSGIIGHFVHNQSTASGGSVPTFQAGE